MLLRKSKKIFIYVFLFFVIATLNNKNLKNFEIPKISEIIVSGLSEKENLEISNNLEVLKKYDLFTLNNSRLNEMINAYNYIENFLIYKRYPSTLDIHLQKTRFIAHVKKNNKNFYIGSNKRLIEVNGRLQNLPFIYGNLRIDEFFKLKKSINESNFKFSEIKNLFFFISGRWDIETQSGILIKLPKSKIKDSLNLYIELMKKNDFKNIKMIDLRQNNQVVVNEQ
tara:strand:- start:6391 stop:7065 length:675 start_codon:yes stop_codon:yes gene_type:complete